MSGGLIALIIAILALIVLIIFGLIIFKKVSHLMREIDKTTIVAQDKIDFFTKDTDAIRSKIDLITQRVNGMSLEINEKMKKLDYFSEMTADFQNALDELKKSGKNLFSQFFSFSAKKSNQSIPSITILKRTAEKVLKKQKMA
ncbi:DUF948 domain-containing protein [Carnobacterium funditum]|uniref:DUF948 domain-containing protein n=1 Tax=Carnobacterium funditum TaxID=2752 RepID=UPI000556A2B7|nr:DUF948 domain-containing protein [Carnobacterium funditum]